MAKVTWKYKPGSEGRWLGPYAYLQESVREHGKSISRHLAYLGKPRVGEIVEVALDGKQQMVVVGPPPAPPPYAPGASQKERKQATARARETDRRATAPLSLAPVGAQMTIAEAPATRYAEGTWEKVGPDEWRNLQTGATTDSGLFGATPALTRKAAASLAAGGGGAEQSWSRSEAAQPPKTYLHALDLQARKGRQAFEKAMANLVILIGQDEPTAAELAAVAAHPRVQQAPRGQKDAAATAVLTQVRVAALEAQAERILEKHTSTPKTRRSGERAAGETRPAAPEQDSPTEAPAETAPVEAPVETAAAPTPVAAETAEAAPAPPEEPTQAAEQQPAPARPTYPDGRLIPREGDEVFQRVAGPFGTPAGIQGVVTKQGRVRVTSSSSLLGAKGPQTGRTYRLTDDWTIVGDPELERRRREREEAEQAEEARRKEEMAAWKQRTEESVQQALSAGQTPVDPEMLQAGDVLVQHSGGETTRLVVTEIDGDDEYADVYARPEDEPGQAGSSIGYLAHLPRLDDEGIFGEGVFRYTMPPEESAQAEAAAPSEAPAQPEEPTQAEEQQPAAPAPEALPQAGESAMITDESPTPAQAPPAPEGAGHDDTTIQRRGAAAEGAGVSAIGPQAVPEAAPERGAGGVPGPAGQGDEAQGREPDALRRVLGPGVELGDPGGDPGGAGGLAHQLEAAPNTAAHDLILSRADLEEAVATPTRRFDANLAALRVLKDLEAEDRQATPEEQAILARYSGFGDSSFSPAFSRYARDEAWQRRGDELRELVSPEEYRALERSRLNAFYTTSHVVAAAWAGLQRLGAGSLDHPRVLEPSAGSGRFLGLQPVELAARSHRTAVELDPRAGGILQQLYPNAETYITGYQDAPIPDASQDLAVSNVPFGDYAVTDRAFKGKRRVEARQIHNYFFAKTLDKLRPGGVLAFVTSHHTLDAPSAQPVREALAERADLLGAIRLPKGAFPDTEVVTDLVFLRKRLPDEAPGDTSWVASEPVQLEAGPERWRYAVEHPVNRYFHDHPEQVLGEHAATGSMYRRDEYSVEAPEGQDLERALSDAVARLPQDVIQEAPTADETPRGLPLQTGENAREGSYVLDDDGTLRISRGNRLQPTGLPARDARKVVQMLAIRDAARAVLQAQLEERPEGEVQAAQQRLAEAYDPFVARHGPLNAKDNAGLMREDPDGPFLRALERRETLPSGKPGKAWEKMPLFSERVVRGLGEPQADTATDAMAVTLNESGRLDFDRMGDVLGRPAGEVQQQLAEERAIFKSPVGGWETAERYLTGNVREKLTTAETAARANPAYRANVEALRAVQPEDLTPSQINVQLGSPWVPAEDVNRFAAELLDARRGSFRDDYFRFLPQTGQWIAESRIPAYAAKTTGEWGTERMPAPDIIERLLNNKPIQVQDKDSQGKAIRNEKETVAAQEKAAAIQERFQTWLWEDPERAERLGRTYNDTFNSMRPRVFDGSHQTFPGMDLDWTRKLRSHQKDAIWRIVSDGTALLGHEVGFGKTAAMVGAGMELRRLGLARKNLYVVPKATHGQFREDFQRIYPYAKVLAPEDADFTPQRRSEFLSRVATGDWDAVIVSDSQYRRIPVTPETEAGFLQDEVGELRAALEAEQRESGRSSSKTHKELQKALVKTEERLKRTQAQIGDVADQTMHFEDLGVDQLFVDESDAYKNLRFTTRMGRIKGLPNSDSQRAWDMYQKVRWLQRRGGGRGVVFATGTPIANTIAELYTNMRYLQEPQLEERGLGHFDAWAKTFGQATEALEQTPTGGFRMTQRFAKFQNAPELSHLWQTTADVRVAEELPEMLAQRPTMVDEQGREGRRSVVSVPATPALRDYMARLGKRAENLANVDPSEDNMLRISNDARLASLDMRMVAPAAEDNPDGKVNVAARKIADIYEETTSNKGTQLVFLDIGTPKAVDKVSDDDAAPGEEGQDSETREETERLRNVYGELRRKLRAAGIPDTEIAFIHEAKDNKAKAALFQRVNDGEVRVLIGSTGKMGAGVNVQQRAAALHHLDAPWRPRDIEQREGRILRQGNQVYGPELDEDGNVLDPGPGVGVYTYVTESSFDAYMWQAIEAKAKAIKAIMRRNVVDRKVEDADSFVLSAGEAKALATGNPDVMRSVQIKNDVQRLQAAKAAHLDGVVKARQEVQALPERIDHLTQTVAHFQADRALAEQSKDAPFRVAVGGQAYTERPAAGEALVSALLQTPKGGRRKLGEHRGFSVTGWNTEAGYKLVLQNPATGLEHATQAVLAPDLSAPGLVQRMENALSTMPARLESAQGRLEESERSLSTYRGQVDKPFPQEERLQAMQAELSEVERRLQGVESAAAAGTTGPAPAADAPEPAGTAAIEETATAT